MPVDSLALARRRFRPKFMGHPKNPSAQSLTRPSSLQVLKQGQENFLDHFFAILRGKPESQQEAQPPTSQLIK